METILRSIGWLVAIIILPIVVLSFATLLFVNSVTFASVDPSTVVTSLEQQDFFEQIAPSVLPAIVEQVPTITLDDVTVNLNTIIMNLDDEELIEISREIIPADWLQEQVGEAIQRTLTGLNDNTTTISETIDLTPVKERLTGTAGIRVAEIILENSEACAPDQIQELLVLLQEDPNARPTLDYICSPPEQYREVMTQVITRAQATLATNLESEVPNPFATLNLQDVTADTIIDIAGFESRMISTDTAFGTISLEIPESFDNNDSQSTTDDSASSQNEETETDNSTLSTIFNLEYLRTLLAAAGVPFIALSLFILFMVRTIRSLSTWWGLVALLSGLLLLFIVPFSPTLIDVLSTGIRTSGASRNFYNIQTEILGGLIDAVNPVISEPLLIQGGILLIMGIVLLVGAFVIPRMFRDDEQDDEFYRGDTQELAAIVR